MGASHESIFALSESFPSLKITTIESTLQQTISNFKELVLDFEQLYLENKNFKNGLLTHKLKPQSEKCSNCERLGKAIAEKENTLDFVASLLNKLIQTKDFNLIDVIFKKINRNSEILTPPKSESPLKDAKFVQNLTPLKENNNELNKCNFTNVKKESISIIIDEKENNDESVSEIESTPTGRKSPIIQSRMVKYNANSLNLKDKKKCPETWLTPEKKCMKVSLLTPTRTNKSSGRLRQSRFSIVKTKSCNLVDLTCSPDETKVCSPIKNNFQCNVKKEIIDNDDTILPSPTSDLVRVPLGYRSVTKDSPSKFKIPLISTKRDINTRGNTENKLAVKVDENMFNIKEEEIIYKALDKDESISLLQYYKKPDSKQPNNSPTKRPLVENINISNAVTDHDSESSMSILQRALGVGNAESGNTVKRNKAGMMDVVYKEPAVRNKLEKRALPGWSCDKCEQFYGELYRDDPDMLAQKMDECSKHRGRYNPVRPKTPEGFWYPRWEVPDDTEEFNRRNNA